LGEGQGKKDVSNEIEDEDELLGNKQDQTDEHEKQQDREQLNKEEQDAGVEMSQVAH